MECFGPCIPAYLDPGSGSAIVSAIIAALAAAGVTIKLYWHKLLRLIKRSFKWGKGRGNPSPEGQGP